MLVLVPILLGLALGVATGGRLTNLLHLRFRWVWIAFLALVVREGVTFKPLSAIDGVQYVYVACDSLLIAWTIWHVRRVQGIWLVTLGSMLNLIVMLANGALMPVATEHKDIFASGHVGQYTLMTGATNLNWLGDWMSVRGPLGGIYSPGDVVIAVGIFAVSLLGTRTKLSETSRRIVSDPP